MGIVTAVLVLRDLGRHGLLQANLRNKGKSLDGVGSILSPRLPLVLQRFVGSLTISRFETGPTGDIHQVKSSRDCQQIS